MKKNLLRATLLVSVLTFFSRVLGLLRDIIIATQFGTGSSTDVFFFANRIPNFFRRLFAEGAFSEAFIPVLVDAQQKKDKKKVLELIAVVSGTLAGVVGLMVLLCMIFSPIITACFAPGWFLDWIYGGVHESNFLLANRLLRITFPYLFFISFVALSGALLNTVGRFSIMAVSPVFLNLSIMGFALFLCKRLAQPEVGLALGVLLGGVAQLFFQIPFLRKEGFLVLPKWDWSHPAVIQVKRLMLPGILGLSVSQINALLYTFMASFLVSGSVSWFYYSDRLIELPQGVFSIAIATVIFPILSQYAHGHKEIKKIIEWSFKLTFLLGIPSAVGLFFLSEEIVTVFFMRGSFVLKDVQAVSRLLKISSIGLVNYMLCRILVTIYHSQKDMATPVKCALITLLGNCGFSLLVIKYSYLGLGLAGVLAVSLNLALLVWFFENKKRYFPSIKLAYFFIQVVCASGLMAVFIVRCKALCLACAIHKLVFLFMEILLSLLIYIMALWLTGVRISHLKFSIK